MPVMQQPEAYIGDAAMFQGGAPTADGRAFLRRVIDGFADWARLTRREACKLA